MSGDGREPSAKRSLEDGGDETLFIAKHEPYLIDVPACAVGLIGPETKYALRQEVEVHDWMRHDC